MVIGLSGGLVGCIFCGFLTGILFSVCASITVNRGNSGDGGKLVRE